MAQHQLQLGVPVHQPGVDQLGGQDGGVQGPPHAESHVTGSNQRPFAVRRPVEHHRHVQFLRRGPQWLQAGVGHVDIGWVAGQHDPQHPQRLHGVFQLPGRPFAVPHGHRGDGPEGRAAVLGRPHHVFVQQPHPVGLFLGRQCVSLNIQPGGQILGAHSVLPHPFRPGLGLAQTAARGPEGRKTGKGQSVAGVGLFNLHAKDFGRLLSLFQETHRRDVGVDIDKSIGDAGGRFLGHGSSIFFRRAVWV